jgi:hypothetical protein
VVVVYRRHKGGAFLLVVAHGLLFDAFGKDVFVVRHRRIIIIVLGRLRLGSKHFEAFHRFHRGAEFGMKNTGSVVVVVVVVSVAAAVVVAIGAPKGKLQRFGRGFVGEPLAAQTNLLIVRRKTVPGHSVLKLFVTAAAGPHDDDDDKDDKDDDDEEEDKNDKEDGNVDYVVDNFSWPRIVLQPIINIVLCCVSLFCDRPSSFAKSKLCSSSE